MLSSQSISEIIFSRGGPKPSLQPAQKSTGEWPKNALYQRFSTDDLLPVHVQVPHLEIVFLYTICNLLHTNLSINELKLDFNFKGKNQQLTLDLTSFVKSWNLYKLRFNWDSEDNEFTLDMNFYNDEFSQLCYKYWATDIKNWVMKMYAPAIVGKSRVEILIIYW